jgi:hypothetical protein
MEARRKLAEISEDTRLEEAKEMIEWLTPFLDVIRSGETSGAITAASLSSIEKLFSYSIISKLCHIPRNIEGKWALLILIDATIYDSREVMAAVANAIVNCRFEASDTVTDEIALMRLLQLIKTSVESPCGKWLTNDMIKSIFDSCFSICFQMRLGELLRKTSESTIIAVVKVLLTTILEGLHKPEDQQQQPTYGIIALETFLNHLIKLLNPADYTNTDNIRLVCLRLICSMLEMSHSALHTLGLTSCILNDEFCRYLFTVSHGVRQ